MSRELFLSVNRNNRTLMLVTGVRTGGAIQHTKTIETLIVPPDEDFLEAMYSLMNDWSVKRNRRVGTNGSTVILQLTEKE